jgi:DNA-binding NarL/FixJ family response regulator
MIASIRILVVDDLPSWRQSIRSILERFPQCTIVGEAADGLEAVQKAGELKPDIVLLDIHLPHMNGLQAATQMHKVVPDSTIIFVTLNTDCGVIEAAMSNGASGYVLKSNAAKELWSAIEAVVQGKKFVSSGLLP